MILDLEKKFETGKNNNTFQRIDAECPHDIFVGYDMGKAVLCVKGKGEPREVHSTGIIQTILIEKENGRFELFFILNEESYFQQFIKFCTDIIENIFVVTEKKLLKTALNTWSCWTELFKGKRSQFLNENQIKGLLAELLFLENYLMPRVGKENAVNAWMGPEMNHKDIEIGETWYEIKAVSSSALTVKINSLEQLDAEISGYLSIYFLDKSNKTWDNAINLNVCVRSIKNKLENYDVRMLFKQKLLKVGYYEDPFYDSICFHHTKTAMYRVIDGFPVISKKELPDGIVKVSYELLIESLTAFLV